MFSFVNITITSSNPETIKNLAIGNEDTIISFENGIENNVPKGFTVTNTGTIQTNDWKIVNDKGNKVAVQLAKSKGSYYNMLVLNKNAYDNVKLSVKIKAVSGDEDQGGGLVWRYIDNNNYYIARYNPLENNFRFYKVVDGNRKELVSVKYIIQSGEWFTMSVEMFSNKVTCILNSSILIEYMDDTFTKAGLVSLWTKADAVTYFDDLSILPIN